MAFEDVRGNIYWIQGKSGSGSWRWWNLFYDIKQLSSFYRIVTTPVDTSGLFSTTAAWSCRNQSMAYSSRCYIKCVCKNPLISLILPPCSERVRPRRISLSPASESSWYTESLKEALLPIVDQKKKPKCVLLHRRARWKSWRSSGKRPTWSRRGA